MSKFIVNGNSIEHINYLVNKDIYGVIVYIKGLSVNGTFYIDVDDINKINFNGKKVYVCLNKIMHNKDLDDVRKTLIFLKDMDVKILFYDMGVYNIAKELNMVDKLVIYQDHLNTSTLSNKFYYEFGITGSLVSSDITMDELLDIKKFNKKMDIYFYGYGYLPIFYSKRFLIKNYLKYINSKSGKEYKIVSDNVNEFYIEEEDSGTTIYTKREVNLINYLDELGDIDYIILSCKKIDDDDFNLMVDRFINGDKLSDCYLGFFKTKTIYKVK